MTTFSDIVDAANDLTIDEQQTLIEIVGRRIAECNRAKLALAVAKARAEFADGKARPASPKNIMDEVRSDS